ncbi:hypothetical protein SK128_005646 [Halocaridina rubra]|uniref:Uncharacterized protein n=1 Tax=Halocaridina rubra TaxID=373956 RepID=A0AAN8X6C3_HALRR
MDGRTVIVTGASAGIGLEAAKEFAARGARVILACRNLIKAEKVANDIKSLTGNSNVHVYALDTSSLESVRRFSKNILQNEENIHVLVNNAGIVGPQSKEITVDGLELTMATNHYGHFLLTNLLLDKMIACAPGRVINVSSAAHMFTSKIDLRDLNCENRSYSATAAYALSKLCNILFTLELAEKLRGTGVTANSLHPGAVATEFFSKEDLQHPWYRKVMGSFMSLFVKLVGKTSELGAQTTIYLGVSDDVKNLSGKYFEDCQMVKSSYLARDRKLARALWEVSEVDVKLRPREEHY